MALPRFFSNYFEVSYRRSLILVDAEIFHVHIPPQAGVEEQVPAGVMIIVVDIHAVAVPFPIAAAIQVVGSYHPIRIVVQHDAPRAVIDPPGNNYNSYVLVTAVGIRAPWADAVVVVVP